MIFVTSIIGFTGPVLLLTTLTMAATKPLRLYVGVRFVLFLLAGGSAFIPINGPVTVVEFMRSFFGDLSITTLLLLLYTSVTFLIDRKFHTPQGLFKFMVVVLVVGLFLYPFSLGFTYFDPYALGYGSMVFHGVLFAIALTAWYFNIYFVVAIIILGISAYLMGIYESRNLWDYLIDPLITVLAFFWVLVNMVKRLISKFLPSASNI